MEIPYRIVQIVTSKFEQHSDSFEVGPDIKMSSGYNFAVNDVAHRVRCESVYKYLQKDVELLDLNLVCVFEVEPSAFNALKNGIDITIPVEFLRYMATICVGTARGIIHARTESTPLSNIVLPPINLVEVIKEPLVVKIN